MDLKTKDMESEIYSELSELGHKLCDVDDFLKDEKDKREYKANPIPTNNSFDRGYDSVQKLKVNIEYERISRHQSFWDKSLRLEFDREDIVLLAKISRNKIKNKIAALEIAVKNTL